MKAYARATDKTRTRHSIKIESAIDILSEILGSREEVIAVISTMLVEDCEFTQKQRDEILEGIKRLHGGDEDDSTFHKDSQQRKVMQQTMSLSGFNNIPRTPATFTIYQ
jgi:hypothetical protein